MLKVTTNQNTPPGFADPTGSFPKHEYHNDISVNKSARSRSSNNLTYGGGLNGVSIDQISNVLPSEYPYADVNETRSGHVIEINDTPGGERILIKHNSGSGIDIRPDGSVTIVSNSGQSTIVTGDNVLIVEGNISIQSSGSLDLNIAGDLNLTVGGNIVTNTGGSITKTINGSSRETIYGNYGSVVKGTRSVTTVDQVTNSSLSGKNDITKGDYTQTIDGNHSMSSSGNSKISSEGKLNVSSTNINMAANSLSLFGATGTIGGEGIYFYSKNMYAVSASFSEGVEAPTFHGDLIGEAKYASLADRAYGADVAAATGTPPAITYPSETAVNTAASAKPTSANIESYLNEAQGGINKVIVDEGDYIKNSIDQTTNTGGVTDRILSTTEVRSRLREANNRNNQTFVGNALSTEVIGPGYSRTVPTAIGRISSNNGDIRTSYNPLPGGNPIDRFRPAKNLDASSFNPNPNYDVNKLPETTPINANLQLDDGITLGRFLGAVGDRVTLDHIQTRAEKLSIARQFMMHASIMKTVMNSSQFKNNRLVVVEGLYKSGPSEILTNNGIKEMATKGQVVVYELHNSSGAIDFEKTYDLAVYWKDTILYDQLILDYDHYNPSGEFNAQIIVVMPEIDENYNLVNEKYQNKIATWYNNNVQSSSDLIELMEDGTIAPPASLDHRLPNNQLNPDLVEILEDAGNKVGVSVQLASGYRPPSSNPSGRHGGDAADVGLIYNGKRLSVSSPEDRIIIEEFTMAFADAAKTYGYKPSAGVANHDYPPSRWYMGGNTFHYDIAVGHSIASNRGRYWGGSGQTADVPAPSWLSKALGIV